MKTLIVLNGDIALPDRADYDYVICCDGGYDFVGDYPVDLLVGDFDSVKRDTDSVAKVTLAREKDFTDGEYAARMAIGRGAEEVDFVGALGGERIDQMLTNLTLLAYCADRGVSARILGRGSVLFLAEGETRFEAGGARYVSFAPLFGAAHIKKSEGLKYAIRDLTITASSSIGVSNEPTGKRIFVDVDAGRLLTVIVY